MQAFSYEYLSECLQDAQQAYKESFDKYYLTYSDDDYWQMEKCWQRVIEIQDAMAMDGHNVTDSE